MRKIYKTHSDPAYYIITMDQNGGKLSGYVTVHTELPYTSSIIYTEVSFIEFPYLHLTMSYNTFRSPYQWKSFQDQVYCLKSPIAQVS